MVRWFRTQLDAITTAQHYYCDRKLTKPTYSVSVGGKIFFGSWSSCWMMESSWICSYPNPKQSGLIQRWRSHSTMHRIKTTTQFGLWQLQNSREYCIEMPTCNLPRSIPSQYTSSKRITRIENVQTFKRHQYFEVVRICAVDRHSVVGSSRYIHTKRDKNVYRSKHRLEHAS